MMENHICVLNWYGYSIEQWNWGACVFGVFCSSWIQMLCVRAFVRTCLQFSLWRIVENQFEPISNIWFEWVCVHTVHCCNLLYLHLKKHIIITNWFKFCIVSIYVCVCLTFTCLSDERTSLPQIQIHKCNFYWFVLLAWIHFISSRRSLSATLFLFLFCALFSFAQSFKFIIWKKKQSVLQSWMKT